MKLAKQDAVIMVTDEGRDVLQLVGVSVADGYLVDVFIQDSEDLGLWLRLDEGEREHYFLLLWQYVAGISVAERLGEITGLKG